MRLLITVLLGCLMSSIFPIFAQESSSVGEYIQQYDVTIEVQTDGRIAVEETIVYDFGNDERHGIFRGIPDTIENKQGELYKMAVEGISVTNEQGTAYEFEETQSERELLLKIGDPSTTISGVHTYIIRYTVEGALRYFDAVDELYWNAIGTEANVPIAQASVLVRLPQSIHENTVQARCFIGAVDENTQCPVAISGYTSRYTVSDLAPGEGMTIVVRFPSGVVDVLEPKPIVSFWDTLGGRLTLVGLGIAALIWYILLPLWLPFKWWMHGRDPSHNGVGETSAWFDPPKTKSGRKLTAAETGILLDEEANIKEITALIIQLAQKGYLKIVEKGKNDFELLKVKDAKEDTSLEQFEKTFLAQLFSTDKTIHLKKNSTRVISAVQDTNKELYKGIETAGFFPHNPDAVRKNYLILAAVAAPTFNIPLLITASIFGRLMPRKTIEGVHASNIARSLRNFLQSQERQLNFQGDKQMLFEKLLPYAIAFGIEKQWAQRFEGIELVQPDWYRSPHRGVFTAQAFSNNLHSSFQSSVNSSATPVSSTGHSSGFSGGSVGGGGGGGSVGSW